MKRTKDKLAKALKEANAPKWMIDRALIGYYDDFEGTIAMPIVVLVNDCHDNGLEDIADRAKDGEFDSTKEEAEEWFRTEGKNLI